MQQQLPGTAAVFVLQHGIWYLTNEAQLFCMKRYIPGILAILVLLAAYRPKPALHASQPQNNWVKLASRTLAYTVDHSQVDIDGLQDYLGALRVRVAKGAINLQRCVVYYKDSQTQDFDVLNAIPQGGESKIIELSRTDQPVTRIVFVYDTKNRAIQKADVEFWGRKN